MEKKEAIARSSTKAKFKSLAQGICKGILLREKEYSDSH